jgi:hypothetical protein
MLLDTGYTAEHAATHSMARMLLTRADSSPAAPSRPEETHDAAGTPF